MKILRPRWKRVIPIVVAAVVIGTLVTLVLLSRLPAAYSMAEMGYADYGGGSVPAGGQHGTHGHTHDGISVATLTTDPNRPADVRVDLTVRQERVTLADGRTVDGYSVNGRTPGPLIEAKVGDLVEVHLTNANVADGATLHWHGVNVPNAEDGVAGVTQDAVDPGESYTYRFVANRTGSYWYHSHQQSDPQVLGGLLGPLVIQPREGIREDADVAAVVHTYGGARTINGHAGEVRQSVPPGRTVRVRVTNTDNAPVPVWVSGAAYRLVAVDGTEVNDPAEVTGKAVSVTAGGRADLAVALPADGTAVRVQLPNSSLVLGEGAAPTAGAPADYLDLLTYGTPTGPLPAAAAADRTFDYVIGRRYGLYDGRPGSWWTINGGLFPDVPMFMVEEGDRVVMRIRNDSGDVHPIHLHGHHVTVLSRNGQPSTGSPWIVDSLNVAHGESYDVAFVADNPGIWMDHCHNLKHAREGLMTHLAYAGYGTPYVVGGPRNNHPE